MKDAKFEIKTFLWNNQIMPSSFRKESLKRSDKIWGYVDIGDKAYCFWGGRGTNELKSIQFAVRDLFYLEALASRKCGKGYEPQSLTVKDGEYPIIDQLYPGFVEHLRNQLLMAKLSGAVRREHNND